MRRILEFISIFDWVTRAVALFDDFAEAGPLALDAWTFFVPYDKAISRGWSADYIAQLLAAHGIKTWGQLVHFGELFFRVKLDQAAWAEYVLTKYSIPLKERSLGAPPPKRRSKRPKQAIRPQQTRHALSFLDDLYDKYLPPPPS